VGSGAHGVDRLDRGRVNSVNAHGGIQLARRRSARGGRTWAPSRVGRRGIRLGTRAPARSVGRLVVLGDGPIGPSPRVMNSVCIYICVCVRGWVWVAPLH
jgi:hypothetical protein